jgi:hypothetical protein
LKVQWLEEIINHKKILNFDFMFKQTYEPIALGHWLKLRRAYFEDFNGVKHKCEMLGRGDAGPKVVVVDMIVILRKEGSVPQLVLVEQYRPFGFLLNIRLWL